MSNGYYSIQVRLMARNKRSNSIQLIELLTPEEEMAAKTKIAHMTEAVALKEMKEAGFKCESSKYYELLKKVRAKYKERKRLMVMNGLEDNHIERMDETKMVISELWKNYHAADKPMDRARILKMIGEFQPLSTILAQDLALAHDKQEELKLKQKERDKQEKKPKEKKNEKQ